MEERKHNIKNTYQLILKVLEEDDLLDHFLCGFNRLQKYEHGTEQFEVVSVFDIFQYVDHLGNVL